MPSFRLFLSQSFAGEKLNHEGKPDPEGISDWDLAEKVVKWIGTFSEGQIEVVRTRDPHDNYISEAVRQGICSCDAVLCLFTKRTKDHVKDRWLPSTYVISEAAGALMQFPSEHDTHRRLFGLVEEGVDREQLGMAFHGNKTAPGFRRDEENRLQSSVKQIVEKILNTPVRPREPWEYLSLDKIVSVLQTGWVEVETRHRLRFTEELSTIQVLHSMWRVSRELPPIDQLVAPRPPSGIGFLRVRPRQQHGRHIPPPVIQPWPSAHNYQRHFWVEFSDLQMRPGDELEYEIAWTYPHAFHNRPARLPDEKPNSVGLLTGERGTVASASLTLKLQRDLVEPERILESHPQVFTTHVNQLQLDSSGSPEEFMHKSPTWRHWDDLRRCPNRSTALYEVYHWSARHFQGMAKITFTPHMNYFDPPPVASPPATAGALQSVAE